MNVDRATIAVCLVSFALFVATISPFPPIGDEAELTTSSYILGIPHPTGFPIYIMLGWLVSHTIAIGTVAWRVAFMSACAMSVTVATCYWIARYVGAPPLAALLGTAFFALAPFVMQKAAIADTHTLTTAFSSLALAAMLRALGPMPGRSLPLAYFLTGLALATHPNAMWTIPALAYTTYRARPSRSHIAVSIALALVPMFAYLELPFRSSIVASQHLDPLTRLPAVPSWLYLVWDSNHTSTFAGFVEELAGSPASHATTAFTSLWRYGYYASFWLEHGLVQFTSVGMVAFVYGFARLYGSARDRFVTIALFGFSALPFAYEFRELEADIDRYYLASFVVVSIGISVALASRFDELPKTLRTLPVLVALSVITFTATKHRGAFEHRFDTGGLATIDAVRHDTPRNAIVLAAWFDCTSLAYARFVENDLGDRIVVCTPLERVATLVPRWQRERSVYVFWPRSSELAASVRRDIVEVASIERGHRLYKVASAVNR